MNLIKTMGSAALLLSVSNIANAIIIEPDDYAVGTDLSNISPHVTISTTDGGPVYSANAYLDQYPGVPAVGGVANEVLGDQVFSDRPDRNSEWYTLPEFHDESVKLHFNFDQPIQSFSITGAELGGIYDGLQPSDPYSVDLYDQNNQLISTDVPMLIGPEKNLDDSLNDV